MLFLVKESGIIKSLFKIIHIGEKKNQLQYRSVSFYVPTGNEGVNNRDGSCIIWGKRKRNWRTFVGLHVLGDKMVVAAAIREEIEIPEGVEVIINNNEVTVKGPNGEDSRKFTYPNVDITEVENNVVLETSFPRKKDKAMIGTTKAHISNMITGVTDGFEYHMKIVFAHFPMTVKVNKDVVVIDNFLGERHPRTAKVVGSAKVVVKGDEVTITGINKEHVGQTMANLEQATKIKGRDPRVFQDGIYLISKE